MEEEQRDERRGGERVQQRVFERAFSYAQNGIQDDGHDHRLHAVQPPANDGHIGSGD
jgi:hypothetical protein